MASNGPPGPLELSREEMRRLAGEVAEAVVARWAELGERPVARLATRAQMEARLREPLPWEGEALDAVLDRFWRDVEPFAGKIDHPRFFAFVPSSPTFASLLGDWLAAGCNFFQGTWLESAGPSQVELVVLDWLKESLGYPPTAGGVLTSGGSAANLMGLAVAREERLSGEPASGVVYFSDQTHTAVDRALRLLGIPPARQRRLPSGLDRVLSPAAVRQAVEEDRAAGLQPFCVVANAGTTNTGAVDPLPELAEMCAEEGLWLHVDGAYGAFARLTVRGRKHLAGLERADSLVLDPHKWLYVGYEAGCLLVRDAGALRRCFHVLPDYLQDTDTGGSRPLEGEVNFADYGIQLSRQARALKLWFSLKAHGFAGMIAAIDRTQHLAELAERRIRATAALELASPARLGILCFRYVGDPRLPDAELDAVNEAIVRRIQAEGRFMISSTRLRLPGESPSGSVPSGSAPSGSLPAADRYVIRLCPMNYRTRTEDVMALLEEVVRLGAVRAGAGGSVAGEGASAEGR